MITAKNPVGNLTCDATGLPGSHIHMQIILLDDCQVTNHTGIMAKNLESENVKQFKYPELEPYP